MAEKKLQPIIIKRIKKGGHAAHGGAWKIAYADFVTAMMAFFLLMWLLGATTEKQAWEVFKPAMQMAHQLPNLRRHFGVMVAAKKMMRQDGSVFEPIIGNPGDGSSPHLAIVDEYHEHDTAELFDTMDTGMGAREQPLMLVISTAGFDPTGPCKQFWDECVKMLAGVEPDDELFALIYTLDDGDDPYSIEALRKANPNFGVSVFEDYLAAQLLRAKRSARNQTKYLIKHCNVWTTAAVTFFNFGHWQAAGDTTLRIEDFIGCPCWFSLDLASKLDVCSMVIVFARYESDGQLHYYLFSRHWLPEETVNDPDNRNMARYQEWIATPWHNSGGVALNATDGAEIDFGEIGGEVIGLANVYSPREVPHDPWNSAQLAQQIAAAGWLPVASFCPSSSTRCGLPGRVRTASLVLNSKYLPGLRMLAGMLSKPMFGLAIRRFLSRVVSAGHDARRVGVGTRPR